MTAPRPFDETVRRRFQRQPRSNTEPEMALRRELWRRGLRYRVDRSVVGRRRRVDIVFAGPKVAVFVDGCFWHGCPQHATYPKNNSEWWLQKLRANIERDRDTDRQLEANGWTVVRIWEHEPPREAADRIEALVRSREPPRSS